MSNIDHYSYRQDMRFRNVSVSLWPLDYIDVLLNLRDVFFFFFIISVCVTIEIFVTFFLEVWILPLIRANIWYYIGSAASKPPLPPPTVLLASSIFSSEACYLLLYQIFIMYLFMFIVYVIFMCIVWLVLLECRVHMGRDICLFCSLKLSSETTVVFGI